MIVNIFTKFVRFICGPANVWKRQRRRRQRSFRLRAAAAAPKQRVSRQNNKHNCVTSSTVPMAATSAATPAASCKMRTSGSRSRRRRQQQQMLRCGQQQRQRAASSLWLTFVGSDGALSLTESNRERERESGRIRVSALAQDLPVLAFSAGVQALQSRATKSRAAQQLRSAPSVSSWAFSTSIF